MTNSASYPFAAVVGLENVKLALLLAIVDPLLKGVIIAGGAGSGKSTLARSLTDLLPHAPFVQIPIGVNNSALLGGLDLEATLQSSTPRFVRGLLAQADGGILFLDDISLMDAGSLDVLSAALDSGVARIEREGLSAAFPSRFLLVGTCDPAERARDTSIASRVGLLVEAAPPFEEERSEVMRRTSEFECDPGGFIRRYSEETAKLRATVDQAKARLSRVTINDDDLKRLCAAAIELGVEGNRADTFAVRAARANAALEGRENVHDEDLIVAIQLALIPRATRLPLPADRQKDEPAGEDGNNKKFDPTRDSPLETAPVAELIINALDAGLPDQAMNLNSVKRTLKGSAGRRNRARRAESTNKERGRYFRSTPLTAKRVAMDATLRAAAPHQLTRRGSNETRVMITARDLRYKEFKRKSGTLFIFAVDASGSMSVNRMAEAKGAMLRLLQKAYLQRDSVALIAFRGKSADLLLAPTRSIELARRSIEALPSGGGTPLAAGLARALDLGRQARRTKRMDSLLVVFTDGRANVALGAGANALGIEQELRLIGAAIKTEGISSTVIDTRPAYVATGDARRLCELIGARYVHLPRPDAAGIDNAIRA